MKERIQKLIDIYCDHVLSTDSEAGWHTPSQLDATQYKSSSGSDLLRRTKFSARYCTADLHQSNDKADEKMINEMRFIRKKHHDFVLAKVLFEKLEDKQLVALLGGRYLQRVYKKSFKRLEIAEYLGMTVDSLKHNKKKGLILIENNLTLIEEYESLKRA
jgi:hypothetical protein